MPRREKHVGSSFDKFLADEDLLDDTTAVAIKRVITWQVQEAMKAEVDLRFEGMLFKYTVPVGWAARSCDRSGAD